MRAHDLAPVFLAAPTSPDERLKRIAAASRGFVYAVSRTGVTGARQKLADDAQKLVRRLRRVTKLPVAVGFGISNAEQFAEVGKFADAVVVGSAIVETIERNPGTGSGCCGSVCGEVGWHRPLDGLSSSHAERNKKAGCDGNALRDWPHAMQLRILRLWLRFAVAKHNPRSG